MTPMCACGTTRLDYDGYFICRHCDDGICDGGCSRCRTFSIVTGKRADA